MGRTVPSITIAFAQERAEWKVYRKHLSEAKRSIRRDVFNHRKLPRALHDGAPSNQDSANHSEHSVSSLSGTEEHRTDFEIVRRTDQRF